MSESAMTDGFVQRATRWKPSTPSPYAGAKDVSWVTYAESRPKAFESIGLFARSPFDVCVPEAGGYRHTVGKSRVSSTAPKP